MCIEALERLLDARVDPRPVALVRIVIGISAFVRALEAQRVFARYFAPTTIRLPYVAWLPSPSESAVAWVVGVWAVAAVLFALGWRTRLSGGVLAAALAYVVLLDEQTYSNHLYLLALVVTLLVLAEAGSAFSLDVRAGRASGSAPAWAVFLLKTQLSAVYAFAAVSKINAQYLSGDTVGAYVSPALLAALSSDVRYPLLVSWSWAAIVLEAFLAVALWLPRLRPGAFVLGAVFHVVMVALLPPGLRLQLTVFAFEMLALYLLFIDPSRAALLDQGRDLRLDGGDARSPLARSLD